jgi:hypothetical protein
MKKLIFLVCFLFVAAACSTEPAPNKNTTSNTNTNSAAATATGPSEADITAKEKAGWDLIKKKDWDGFGKTLASDYIEVEDDGVYDKAGIMTFLKDFDLSDVTFADWKMLTIDKDAAIVTYTVTVKANYKGTAVPRGPYRAAAGYVNRGGSWVAIYYQETLIKTGPAPSPAAANAAKPAATAGAKMADAGPDATADEKLVWDALKNKKYDDFAAYLAPDSVEVEADGVYDKSGSVKGVSNFDFSKATLSDWKTVKFDNDASLVTYMVKIPGMNPDQERHTTIWVNRNGKWMALFHQGTPVAKPEPKKM